MKKTIHYILQQKEFSEYLIAVIVFLQTCFTTSTIIIHYSQTWYRDHWLNSEVLE